MPTGLVDGRTAGEIDLSSRGGVGGASAETKGGLGAGTGVAGGVRRGATGSCEFLG